VNNTNEYHLLVALPANDIAGRAFFLSLRIGELDDAGGRSPSRILYTRFNISARHLSRFLQKEFNISEKYQSRQVKYFV